MFNKSVIEPMEQDRITRADVDNLAVKILVNFSIINTAAIAAVIGLGAENITIQPFAIGLISSIIAQIVWYMDAAIEYAYNGNSVCDNEIVNFVLDLLVFICVTGGGILSGGSIFYGCLVLIKVPCAFLISSITCGSLFVIFLILLIKSEKA